MGTTDLSALAKVIEGTVSSWSTLTVLPRKAELYSRDPHFRTGLAEALSVLGEQWRRVIHQVAFVLVKPDGLAAGAVDTVLEFGREHGYRLIAAHVTDVGRHWRELWRYQLNAATIDRLLVTELLLDGNGLGLFFAQQVTAPVPASVRFNTLKGPSNPAAQSPNSLRRRLACPNRFVNFVHSADEPADVLRELAILYDSETLREIFEVTVKRRRAVFDGIGQSVPIREMNPAAAAARIQKEIERMSSPDRDALLTSVRQVISGQTIGWQQFRTTLRTSKIDVDRWDLALFGSIAIVYDELAQEKCIDSADPSAWERVVPLT